MTSPSKPPSLPPDHAPSDPLEDFAARVAHDFNNLLTGILGNLELLQYRAQRNSITGLDGYLEGANSAGGRAVAFATRLMEFSGRGTCRATPVQLDDFLSRYTGQASCRLDAGNATLFCDPAQLELGLNELLDNAAAAGGDVYLTSSVTPAGVRITIRDTGHGMAPDILARAAEPFFTTAANGTGRGLGLCIAARVLRDIGGHMEMTAQDGAGCTVTLHLPLA